jgi:hypothetical protein
VIAAVGVIVAVAVNVTLLVAINTTAAVLTEKSPPKLIVSAASVVNVPPDFEYPPLKLIVAPAPAEFVIVPPVCVTSPENVTEPVDVALIVPLPHVKPAARVNDTLPVETVMELTFVADSEGVPATVSD